MTIRQTESSELRLRNNTLKNRLNNREVNANSYKVVIPQKLQPSVSEYVGDKIISKKKGKKRPSKQVFIGGIF